MAAWLMATSAPLKAQTTPVADGKKSVAFTLTYQDESKTLTDDDVAPVHGNILKALEETLGAVLREM